MAQNGLWFYATAFILCGFLICSDGRWIIILYLLHFHSITHVIKNQNVLLIITGNFADLWYDYGKHTETCHRKFLRHGKTGKRVQF